MKSAVLIASISVILHCGNQSGQADTFVGKIMIFSGAIKGESKEMPHPLSFYGTHLEILQSKDIARRAQKRIQKLQPELKESVVKIEVTRIPDTGVVTVTGEGKDLKYTKVFVDALMDEYREFVEEVAEKSGVNVISKVIEEVLLREREMKLKMTALDDFVLNHDVLQIEEDREKWRKVASEGAVGDAAENARGKAAESDNLISSYQILRRDYDRACSEHQDWKKTLDRIESSGGIRFQSSPVIIERASVLVPH